MADSGVTISLKGFGDLEKALRSIGVKAAKRVGAKAMKASAQPILDMAKILVPIDTGELEDSIKYAPGSLQNERRELTGKIGFKKPASRRAHFVEYGTIKMAAQPFMRPAIDSKAEMAIAIMGAEMWKGIAAEAAKAPKGGK